MFVVANAHIRWCNAAIENSDLASNPQRDIQLSVIQSMVQSDNAEAVEKWLTAYTNGEYQLGISVCNSILLCLCAEQAAKITHTLADVTVQLSAAVRRCRQFQKQQLKQLQVHQSGTKDSDQTKFVHLWHTNNDQTARGRLPAPAELNNAWKIITESPGWAIGNKHCKLLMH